VIVKVTRQVGALVVFIFVLAGGGDGRSRAQRSGAHGGQCRDGNLMSGEPEFHGCSPFLR
jgi:hypothetical protein